MSYDINCLVLGVEEDLSMPVASKILVETEYSPNSNSGRYYGAYPFMTMQKGTWVNLLNSERSFLGAFGLCDIDDSEIQNDVAGYPVWIQDEELYDLSPIVVFDEYIEEFRKILNNLVSRSTNGRMMFLARYQGVETEVVCGTIPMTRFFELLSEKRILFNVCYILCIDGEELANWD